MGAEAEADNDDDDSDGDREEEEDRNEDSDGDDGDGDTDKDEDKDEDDIAATDGDSGDELPSIGVREKIGFEGRDGRAGQLDNDDDCCVDVDVDADV